MIFRFAYPVILVLLAAVGGWAAFALWRTPAGITYSMTSAVARLAGGGNRVLSKAPLALRANRAGWAVADNVTGKRAGLPGIAGSAVFKVFDLQVARTGLSMREAETFGFEPVETVIKPAPVPMRTRGPQPCIFRLLGIKNQDGF